LFANVIFYFSVNKVAKNVKEKLKTTATEIVRQDKVLFQKSKYQFVIKYFSAIIILSEFTYFELISCSK